MHVLLINETFVVTLPKWYPDILIYRGVIFNFWKGEGVGGPLVDAQCQWTRIFCNFPINKCFKCQRMPARDACNTALSWEAKNEFYTVI